jgi:hypothetical protein
MDSKQADTCISILSTGIEYVVLTSQSPYREPGFHLSVFMSVQLICDSHSWQSTCIIKQDYRLIQPRKPCPGLGNIERSRHFVSQRDTSDTMRYQ